VRVKERNNTMNKYIIPNWPAPKNIRAYSSTRLGGHSNIPYDSFNLANHVGDNPADVLANRQQLIAELKLPHEPVWLEQVHGINAVDVDKTQQTICADAAFTRKPNTLCNVLTADCLPVLICNQAGTEIAAIHAGWKGCLAGVIENTIAQLQSPPEELLAWLGPAIGPEKFEVGEEVLQAFTQHDPQAAQAFKPNNNTGWLANIVTLAKQRLNASGVAHIYGGDFCTVTDNKRFFSYRRDGEKSGRMVSLIWML